MCVCFLFFVVVVVFHVRLAGRPPFGGFEVVSAVLFPSFGVSCLLG